MAQQPFTPAGVLAKQTELYALSDSSLLTEARTAASDFRTFLNTHFTFTTSQATWLTGLDPKAEFSLGSQVASVLILRGAITMSDIPINEDGRPKEIKTEITGGSHYDDDSGEIEGDLGLDIDWELL